MIVLFNYLIIYKGTNFNAKKKKVKNESSPITGEQILIRLLTTDARARLRTESFSKVFPLPFEGLRKCNYFEMIV